MDFQLSREQEMLRNMVRSFAETEVAPRAAALDEACQFPYDLVKRIGEQGLIGMFIPKEYGGPGMGYLARALVLEEMSRVYPPLGFFFEGGDPGMYLILTYGNDDMKRSVLPQLCKGDKIACFAVTEATGGSNPADMQTTADASEGGYIINGRKVFITMGSVADYICLAARTGEKYSAFMVEKGTPGFEAGHRENVVGVKSLPVDELVFNGVKVPVANHLGEDGQGLVAALGAITLVARPGVASVALGLARGAFEEAVSFTKERKMYGAPLINLQALQFALADMETEIEASRWLVYYLGWLLDQGKSSREVSRDSSRAKLFATETAKKVTMGVVQMMGGYGTIYDYKVVSRLTDALTLLPAGGTQEVMRMTLGREIAR
ncbi:MAG: acyl-CoA dehydrogenase family protein [Dehalococcoidia bacterium]|nr:acyl-CoA dehydrogenase family protein [Dehalococcoidia bacterium]